MSRHAACDRVDRVLHVAPIALHRVREIADGVLCLRHRHAVARDDDHRAGGVQDLGRLFERGLARAALAAAVPLATLAPAAPNAPKRTLLKVRFIAFDIIIAEDEARAAVERAAR